MPIVTWLLRDVVIRFVLFSAILAGFTLVMGWLLGQLEGFSPQAVKDAFAGLPAGIKYFLVLFQFDVGIPMLLSAMVTRFVIRRLPMIG